MTPGGVQEIISFFAGHMHLTDDVVRLRDVYLDPAYDGKVGQDPDTGISHSAIPISDLSDIGSSPFVQLPLDPDRAGGFHPPHHFLPPLSHHSFPIYHHAPDVTGYAAPSQYPASFLNFYSISVTSSPDAIQPQDEAVNVLQTNKLNAIEFLGVDPNGHFPYLNGAPLQIEQLTAMAGGLLPDGFGALDGNQTDGLSLISTNTDALGLVNEHDAALANGSAAPHSLALGEYVNGVFDANHDTAFPQVPVYNVSTAPPAVLGYLNPGLSVTAGSNYQLNEAGIFSDNAQHSTLMVLGNYYSTNAIFQTNILEDINHITTTGAVGSASITTGNDQLQNIASFYQQDFGPTNLSGSGNSSWHVNVDYGNFFDLNVVAQTNVLAAGGASFQTTQSTYYQAITGGNQQVNGMLLDSAGHPYDLVIVEGSYNNANIIYQNNIVLSDNVVQATVGSGTAGSAATTTAGALAATSTGASTTSPPANGSTDVTVSTGGNSLTNAASIANYGSNNFAPLTGQLAAEAQSAQNGAYEPLVGHASAGNGTGQLNVLVVTGNFYDINVVAQTNVLSSANHVTQMMPGAALGTTATENISVGANQAFNLAQIVDVGTSGMQYVGGQQYSDTLLLQANIVTQQATVTAEDPQTLAHEVVAFVGDGAAATATAADNVLGTSGDVHHDFMGSALA